MKTIKFFYAMLIALVVVLLLVSCGENSIDEKNDTSSVADTTETFAENTENNEKVLEYILTSDIVKYNIIRPEDASADLIDTTADFYREIKSIYGDTIRLKDDFVIPGNAQYSASEFEILVGNTNRDESISFLEQLRVNDYGYAVIDKKIVIAGGSDDATALAIEKFLNDIIRVKKDTEEILISSDELYIFNASYAIDKLAIGEADISTYTIVYKYMGTYGERELAQSIQDSISMTTGYELDVISDKEDVVRGNEILVGQTNRDVGDLYSKPVAENGYYIGTFGNNVVIWGASSFATMTAVNEFSKKITDCTNSILTISETLGVIQEGVEFRAMSFNVWVSSRSDARDDRVIQMVLDYMPDVIGFQETGSSWMSTLIKRLGVYYNYVGEGRDGGSSGEYNPIFYRKDKFTLLESGTYWLSDTPDKVSKFSESSLNRIYTYARLRRNSDGIEFLHINTHFDHKSSAAREKQAEVLVDFIVKQNSNQPMIITGDFNCESTSTEYKTIVNSSVVSSSVIAEKKKNVATFHNYGNSNKIIDFIFVTPAQIHVLNYTVCNEKINGDYASDHHPVCIDYYILN